MPLWRRSLWRRSLLAGYYHATRPLGWYQRRRAMVAGQAPIAIVLFHRIADDRANGWTTSTRTFIKAIGWLQKHFDLISLQEAQRRLRGAHNPRPAVCITFDDGYAVNCRRALPLLIERGIPCTYFVSTDPVLSGEPFLHDRAMGNDFTPNTIDELQRMARAGIEIGAHTRTHANLARVTSAVRLFDEVVQSRNDLQDALGHAVRYFAFPFGLYQHLSSAAFQLASEAGFDGVCSAYGGYNLPGDDAFHLQRRGFDDSLYRVKNWVMVDPLRNRNVRRFSYTHENVAPPSVPVAVTATGAMATGSSLS